VVLPALVDDLLPLLMSAAAGSLNGMACAVGTQPHVGVVLASGGYPDTYATGKAINGLDEAGQLDDVLVFHAGTAEQAGRVVTAGGRVLTIVGRGPDFTTAIARAYAGVDGISFEGKQFRSDIGQKAIRSFRSSAAVPLADTRLTAN
jgi:phosphoribosylamine--glycine ligase